MIRADGVEISEFPHLAVKYEVRSVPQTVVNEEAVIYGMLPEKQFLERILEIVQNPPVTG